MLYNYTIVIEAHVICLFRYITIIVFGVQVKSAFTRAYNSGHHRTHYAASDMLAKKSRTSSVTDYHGDDEDNPDTEPELDSEDLSQDRMIKAKSRQTSSALGEATKGSKKKGGGREGGKGGGKGDEGGRKGKGKAAGTNHQRKRPHAK